MGHKRYCLVYNTFDTIDGIEFNTFEEAKANMIDQYINWEIEETEKWKVENNELKPTGQQIDSWNAMVDECWCSIVEWDKKKEKYEDPDDGYTLSARVLDEIGWKWWEELEIDRREKMSEDNIMNPIIRTAAKNFVEKLIDFGYYTEEDMNDIIKDFVILKKETPKLFKLLACICDR